MVNHHKKKNKNKRGRNSNIPGPLSLRRTNTGVERLWNALAQPIPMRTSAHIDNVPYKVIQETYNTGVMTTSTTIATFGAIYNTLSQLDQVSTLQSLFDQYRIVEIEHWLIPELPSATNVGEVASVNDYDDATPLTSFGSALDYQNVLVGSTRDGHYRRFKPHCAVAAYSGAFTSYGNVASPWIDCTSPTVQHYGMKLAATVTTVAINFNLVTRFHLEFRNIR
jgi:hypothetical protein